ncbi:hypothetical protein SAMN06297422_101168 [Lachnospiraceae bacterium]|nr:hypothetical protein SAMN06297422_101168 [Lachnospiraceae bacterium]
MNWEFGKVTDYFDNSIKNCIWEYSQEYGKLSDVERYIVNGQIRDRIEGYLEQVRSYNVSLLPVVLGTVVDDIYRSGNLSYYYNDDVAEYLSVTAKVVLDWYKQKGIQIHYMTNNSFSDQTRPLIVFPEMFTKAGLIYICPQQIMYDEMRKNGISPDQFAIYAKDFVSKTLQKTKDITMLCCETGTHYIHLDIDGDFSAFNIDFSYIGKENHVLVFREEAPQDSAKITYL